MQISWDEARGIMERAVARGLVRREELVMPHLAADEKSYRKGRHFVTLLMDLDRDCIHGTAPGNGRASLEILLKGLTEQQKLGVEAIAMDMHEPYRLAAESAFPVPRLDIVGLTKAVAQVLLVQQPQRTSTSIKNEEIEDFFAR